MEIRPVFTNLTTRPKTFFLGVLTLGGIGLFASAFGTPATSVAILFVVLIGLAALIRPDYTVAILALYIPFEPFILKYISDDLYVYVRYGSEAIIYLLLAAALVYCIRKNKRPTLGPAGLWLLIFSATLGLSAIINHVPLLTAGLGLRQILRFPLLYLAVVNLPISRPFMKKLIWLLAGVALVQAVIGIGQAIIGGPADSFLIPDEARLFGSLLLTPGTDQYWAEGQRITATMGRYDQLGTFLAFFGLIGLGLLYEHPHFRTKRKILAGLMVVIIALALTYSRAAWFGFVIGLILIALLIKRDRRIFIGTILIILTAVLYPFFTSITVNNLMDRPDTPIITRLYEAFSYERWRSEYYGLGRTYFIVKTATTVFPAAPIFGFGPGQYGGGAAASLSNYTVYDQLGLPFGIYGTTGQIDNNWLSLLGETGAVGVILYILMLGSLARFAWRLYRTSDDRVVRGMALGYLGALTAVIFQAGLGTHFEVRTLGTYLWLVPALLASAEYSRHSRITDEDTPSQ